MNNNNETHERPKRVITIFKEFLKGRTLTSEQIQMLIRDELDIFVSLRTIQRDLRLMRECLPMLEQWKEGKQSYWKLLKEWRDPFNLYRIESSELLSFHILKSHLKTFEGTAIEKDAARLAKKLEKFAPGEAFSYESLYWDQNFGYYDYAQKSELLDKVIEFIIQKKWASITYFSMKNRTLKSYDVLFRRLFTYTGTLYIVTYFPKYKTHESISLHGIQDISESSGNYEEPGDFDFRDFTSKRFGVYTGKAYEVKLCVKKDFVQYFINRRWHRSQKNYFDDEGNLILGLTVPIGMDLVGWLLSWNEVVRVISPPELIGKLVKNAKALLGNYQS